MPFQRRFPTPIYFEHLLATQSQLSRFNRELLEQCYLVRETDEAGQEWSQDHYPHGYTSYGSITDLHRRFPHFEELGKYLNRHARKFSRHLQWDLGDGHLELSSLWINIMPTHTAHSLHLHPLSVISGTYYVRTPKNSSAIKFEDPRLDRMMAAPPKLSQLKNENQLFVQHHPKAGQVGMWESWLRHEVPSQRGTEDRVSVSFNYDWV